MKGFKGMRIEEAINKTQSILGLARLINFLFREKDFQPKFLTVKNLQISLIEFWGNLQVALMRETNVKFERHKLLSKKQGDRSGR